jgi:putative oxidoreductase
MKAIHQSAERHIRQFTLLNSLELFVRIIAGLFLILDGVHILSHTTQLEELLKQTMSFTMSEFLIYFIGVAHLLGGTFIVLGLFTRVAIVIQIPAILTEMYYIQPPNSFLGNWEILASAILMILLVFLFATNSGKASLDYYRNKR